MSISFVCECGAEYRVKDEFAGRQTKCRDCGRVLTIPSAGPVEFKLPPLPPISSDEPGPGEDLPMFDTGDDFSRPRKSSKTSKSSGNSDSLLGMNREVGMLLIVIGLLLVVFSRTFESVLNRGAARTIAQLDLARGEFDSDVEYGTEEFEEMQEEMEERQKSADNANANVMAWSFWLAWPFMIGTLLLVSGLLVLAFIGEPAEQRVCIVMIAIITFSLYIGGFAWVDSIVNSGRAVMP